jgi:hypothetical protein
MAILMVRLRLGVTGRGATRRGSRAGAGGRAGRRTVISESPLTSCNSFIRLTRVAMRSELCERKSRAI